MLRRFLSVWRWMGGYYAYIGLAALLLLSVGVIGPHGFSANSDLYFWLTAFFFSLLGPVYWFAITRLLRDLKKLRKGKGE